MFEAVMWAVIFEVVRFEEITASFAMLLDVLAEFALVLMDVSVLALKTMVRIELSLPCQYISAPALFIVIINKSGQVY